MDGRRGTVLIVEDIASGAELLASIIEEEGFRAEIAATAADASERFGGQRHIAVLLDWMLPDGPGIEICRDLRSRDPLVPIIFVSGRDDEATAARGLDAGADDYMVKPIRRTELMARLEAHLRKSAAGAAAAQSDPEQAEALPPSRFGDIEIDVAARIVRVAGDEVSLGHLEFDLLTYFTQNPGVALSRENIVRRVYGLEAQSSTDRVDVLVRRLRMKLGNGARRAGLVVAVPGFGYRLERRSAER